MLLVPIDHNDRLSTSISVSRSMGHRSTPTRRRSGITRPVRRPWFPTPAQPDEGTRWVQSSLNVLMGAGLNVDGISGPDDPTALSVRIADFFPITWSNTARGGICYIAVTILALSS
jgi:hypothetical protein